MPNSMKYALAQSLKKLLSVRKLDKITVKDIVEDCGVNRQTFYYYFRDIYDLLEWNFQDAAEKLFRPSLSRKLAWLKSNPMSTMPQTTFLPV